MPSSVCPAVQVAPICRGDLVCLPKSLCGSATGTFALVTLVGGLLHLVDPTNGKRYEVAAESYWRHPFQPLMSRKQLGTFVVLDVDLDETANGTASATSGAERMSNCSASDERGRHTSANGSAATASPLVMADATVARERDFGSNDATHYIRTHLGGLLEAGDEAVGYDLDTMANLDYEGSGASQSIFLVSKKKERERARAKRGSGAARRRSKRGGGGGGGGDDGGSTCSGTSYQTDYSDLAGLDALAVALHEEDDDEGYGLGEGEEDGLLGAGLSGFLGDIEEGDEEAESETAEAQGMPHHAPVSSGSGEPDAERGSGDSDGVRAGASADAEESASLTSSNTNTVDAN